MASEVVVICPEFGSGGVGDYTLRVLEQWQGIAPRLLVANAKAPPHEYRIDELDGRARAIHAIPADARLLVQYSAYGFHAYGYPRALLRTLADWKRTSRGALVVMFHEIWTFWPLLNKNRPLQSLHRRDIGALTRSADAVFTSTRSQAEHLRSASGRSDVGVLPVGSNIRRSVVNEGGTHTGRAVLFGLQPSRLATLRKMHEHLQSLAASAPISSLVVIGGGNRPAGDAEEKELVARLQLREGVEFRGALPEHEVSALLSSASFAISTQDELSVTKSGTFIAYAAHGLNIISPHARASASEPLCWATHPQELQAGIAEAELRKRAESLRSWHDRTCSWPRIAGEFVRALRLELPRPMTAATPLS